MVALAPAPPPHPVPTGALRRPSGSFRLIFLSLALGAVIGCLVFGVQNLVVLMQRAILGFAAERRVVLPDHASYLRIFLALAASGLLLALLAPLFSRKDGPPPIDAVEANALRGGTMQWFDAIAVVLPILLSVCFGASVGIEAAVTQIGAVLASRLGRLLKRPRSDLRILVGAGAAAAIAAAYRAPIAGVLYAFELVIGTYAKRTLAPVGAAALAAVLTMWLLSGQDKPFQLDSPVRAGWIDYPIAILIGLVAACLGIAIMLLVTAVERWTKPMPGGDAAARVVVAGLLTLLALRYPAVLGSGHAAIERAAHGDIVGRQALGLLGAKSLASAASLGTGFRGGLFSASLMIGALLGQVMSWALSAIPGVTVEPNLCAIVGMAALGASIIGSPLAMVFLVLETTGDFDAAVLIAMGAVTASFLTDRLFGYSFATWRFQQRGLAIDGGQDISRLSSTTIESLIRAPGQVVGPSAPLRSVIPALSRAGTRGTVVEDEKGRFLGVVDPALVEVAAAAEDELPLVAADLVHATNPAIVPTTTLSEITALLSADDRTTLAVFDPKRTGRIVGCVRARDVFALASEVSDAQRQEELGLAGSQWPRSTT